MQTVNKQENRGRVFSGQIADVSVVIPTKDRVAELCQTVSTLLVGAETLPSQVIIVDQTEEPSSRVSLEKLWRTLDPAIGNSVKLIYYHDP